MMMLGHSWNSSKNAAAKGYYLLPSQGPIASARCTIRDIALDPAFFDKLGAADIILDGRRVGVIGVVHPEVLSNFGLKNPCGAL